MLHLQLINCPHVLIVPSLHELSYQHAFKLNWDSRVNSAINLFTNKENIGWWWTLQVVEIETSKCVFLDILVDKTQSMCKRYIKHCGLDLMWLF